MFVEKNGCIGLAEEEAHRGVEEADCGQDPIHPAPAEAGDDQSTALEGKIQLERQRSQTWRTLRYKISHHPNLATITASQLQVFGRWLIESFLSHHCLSHSQLSTKTS